MVFVHIFTNYTIQYAPQAKKDLKKIDPNYAKAFQQKFHEISLGHQNADIKKLQGAKDSFRLRIGPYRAIFIADNQTITILVISINHRKDAYDH